MLFRSSNNTNSGDSSSIELKLPSELAHLNWILNQQLVPKPFVGSQPQNSKQGHQDEASDQSSSMEFFINGNKNDKLPSIQHDHTEFNERIGLVTSSENDSEDDDFHSHSPKLHVKLNNSAIPTQFEEGTDNRPLFEQILSATSSFPRNATKSLNLKDRKSVV